MCTWSNKLDEKEEEEKKKSLIHWRDSLVWECVRVSASSSDWQIACSEMSAAHTIWHAVPLLCVCAHICVCVIKCVCVSALHSQECVRVTGRQTDGRRAKERQQGAGKSIDNVTSFLILHWHCDTLRCCVCSAGSLPSRVRVQKIQDVKSVP